MAEPDWALWQSILQQLQADNVEIKQGLGTVDTRIKEVDARVAAVEREVQGVHEEITYALGMMVNLGRNVKDAQTRIDDVVKRLEKLEAR
jgi:chromosome segregation ATPase